jgi:hypothetical protein
MPPCPNCGAEMDGSAAKCFYCGAVPKRPPQPAPVARRAVADPSRSDKSAATVLVLCLIVGGFGVHRFYVGKVGTGILWALTGGLLGIGWLVDVIVIASGQFKDSQGRRLSW